MKASSERIPTSETLSESALQTSKKQIATPKKLGILTLKVN
jgi:hypothetical protein